MALERYNRDNPLFDGASKINAEKRMKWANNLCKGDVLDIGCGYGYLAGLCYDNPNVKSYLGFDYDGEAIDRANKENNNNKCHFRVYDAYDDKILYSADTVVCTEFLEHIEKPYQVELLGEIKKIFNKQGHGLLIGSTPFVEVEGPNKAGNDYHVWEHTYDSFKEMLDKVFDINFNIKLWKKYDCGHCIFFEVKYVIND